LPADDEEALSTLLWELGTAGTQSLGVQDGRASLLAYFADQDGLEDRLRDALRPLRVGITPAEIPDVDWVARVREGFQPFTAGSFRIVPAWEATVPAPAGDRVIVVEPGLAFGTGTHESTRLCLAALEERARAGPLGRVLDVGAGSGILSVAAARLGAERVVAIELDEEALPVARRHAELNRSAAVVLVRGDGARAVRPAAFDVVLANISAPLLAERVEELVGTTRGHGVLILSGFLVEDLPSLRAAYAAGGDVDVRVEGEWTALVVQRRP
jgi:ribosomal protein L11 methyltransferase